MNQDPGVPPRIDAPGSGRASLSGVARGGALNAVGAVVSAVLGFAVTLCIARGFSREAAGVFFNSTSAFLVLVAVGQLGTNVGLVYFVSRSRVREGPDMFSSYVRAAGGPVLVWNVVLGIAIFAAAPALGELIGSDRSDDVASALRVLAPFVLAAAVENLAVSASRGLGTMRPTAVLTLVARPAIQVVLVLGAVAVAGPSAAVGAWATGYVLCALAAVVWVRRLGYARPGMHPPQRVRVGRDFWAFTAPRALVTVAQIAMQRLDIVLVGALAGAAPAAVYAATTRFLVAGQLGTQSISLAAQPGFAHFLAAGDRSRAEDLYRMSTAWLVLVAWPLYLVLAIFSSTILRIFGPGYVEGAPVLVILAAALMFGAVVGVVEVVLVMAGHSGWTLVNSVSALSVMVLLDVWLIPRHGAFGASIGWGCAIVVRNALALLQVRRTLGLHPFGRASALTVAITLGGVGVPLLMCRVLLGPGLASLAVGLLVAGVCHLSATYVLRRQLHVPALLASLRRRRSA